MFFPLTVAALPALVAALFVHAPHQSISVPLRKRSSLTTDAGDFDLDAARAHLAFTEAYAIQLPCVPTNEGYLRGRKISAGFHALGANAGETSISRRDPGSIPLTNDQGTNARWYGTISVGTPPVDFKGLSPVRVLLCVMQTCLQWISTRDQLIYSCLHQRVARHAVAMHCTIQIPAQRPLIATPPSYFPMAVVHPSRANSTPTRSSWVDTPYVCIHHFPATLS